MKWTLSIPLVPPSLNKYIRYHWKERNSVQYDWDLAVWALCKEQGIPPCDKVNLSATIYFKTNRRRDIDNQMIVYKIAQDSLVTAGVIVDDNADIVSISPPILDVDPKNPRTEVTIEGCVSSTPRCRSTQKTTDNP